MITLLGGIYEDSLSMGFLSNWFVAYEVISGSTCRHLAGLYGLGKYLLGKTLTRGRTTFLKPPSLVSCVTKGLIFYFFKGNNQLTYTEFAVLSLSHPGKILPKL